MGPCMYRPHLAWPRLKGNVRYLTATLLQRYCDEVCSPSAVHGACLASLPLLSRFGVGADLICSLCCRPPWGEEPDMQLCGSLFQSRTVAIHCFSPSAFWKFRSQVQWSSPCCHTMATVSLVAVCGKAVLLSYRSCALEPAKGSCCALKQNLSTLLAK